MKLRIHNTLTTALGAVTLLAALPFTAAAVSPDYAMVVFDESRHADQVKSLDYATTRNAVAALEAAGAESFDALNNLCVAYTMTQAFDEAEAACNAAVAVDKAPEAGVSASAFAPGGHSRKTLARDREAVALSNRGVLRAVTGDLVGARGDFERASAVTDRVEAAEINLTRLTDVAVHRASIAHTER